MEIELNGQPVNVLIDSGAGCSVISKAYAERNQLALARKLDARQIILADGTILDGSLQTTATLTCRDYSQPQQFVVMPLVGHDVLLGRDWLHQHNPHIDWQTGIVHLRSRLPWHLSKPQPSASTEHHIMLCSRRTFSTLARQKDNHCFGVFATTELLSNDQQQQHVDDELAITIMQDFQDVFPKELPGLPPSREVDHAIELSPGVSPPCRAPYRLAPHELAELQKTLKELLNKGLIRHSTSPFGLPVLFVRKKDGSLRMCIDYRALNNITVKNRYPLPHPEDLLNQVAGAKWFSVIDLKSGYHQVRIKAGDEHKTAFRTRFGLYEWMVMPFGLTNAPSTFQRMMNDIFRDCLDKFVIVFLDDILIYSKTKEDHAQHLRLVLQLLRQNQLYAQPAKCRLVRQTIDYIGHTISKDGISPMQDKVSAILDWATPANVSELRSFLGAITYYHRHIAHMADIGSPLYELLSTKSAWRWEEEQQQAFIKLKQAIKDSATLTPIVAGGEFVMHTDASDVGIGAALEQITDDSTEPKLVAFHSRRLGPAERNYSTHDRELLAVVDSLKTWRHWLAGQTITVITDHRTLQFLHTQSTPTGRHARWLDTLAEYNVKFVYKPGKDNIVADALSRRPPDTEAIAVGINVLATAAPQAKQWLQTIRQSYPADPWFGAVHQQLSAGVASKKFELRNGLIYLKHTDRICLPDKQQLRLDVLHDCHDIAISGHQGTHKTLELVKRQWHWPGLDKFVTDYVTQCDSCQRNKSSRQATAGLLQPLPVPDSPWQSVSMDFIVALPKSDQYDAIVTFTDRMTKMLVAVPTSTNLTAPQTAEIFFRHIFCQHGMPTELVSDRDPRFSSQFWQELFRSMGVKIAMTTAYHPSGNGQAERMNQSLEGMIRTFTNYHQSDWSQLLPQLVFAYNNTVNASTRHTPFYLNYGRHPTMPHALAAPGSRTNRVEATEQFIEQQQRLLTAAKQRILEAQKQQAKYANKKRRDDKFEIGDRVLLSTKHIMLDADRERASRKFTARWIGPFAIKRVINPSVYELDLPSTLHVHPVFNIMWLKRYKEDTIEGRKPPPQQPLATYADGSVYWEIERIVDHRRRRGSLQYLVKWLGFPEHDNTWEPRSTLVTRGVKLKQLVEYENAHNISAPTRKARRRKR